MTDARKLEDFRVYSQKMELLVALANDVAHSFNEVLQIIRSNLELATLYLDEDDKCYRLIEEAWTAVQKGADLTARLEILGKGLESQKQKIDIVKEIHRIKHILRRNLPDRIKIKLDLDTNLPPIKIDPFQLEQLLLHMALNSKDAIKSEGTFTIKIRNTVKDLIITVTDDGEGMSNTVKAHLFEPFFTTKVIDNTRMSLSTGLGLYIVNRIIQSNKGTIKVHSKEKEGTSFIITFPTVPRNGDRFDTIDVKIATGIEKILIVDDEDGVRNSLLNILNFFGYAPVAAPSATEGLLTLSDSDISLVLLDRQLPDIDDITDFIFPAISIRPELKIIIISGHIREDDHKIPHVDAVIQKPFCTKDLLKKLREVLDKNLV